MKNSRSRLPATFEGRMARLQEIVSALEDGQLPLEKGMALYQEGVECSRLCREQLEKARHQLSIWQDGEEKPFALNEAVSVEADEEE